MQVKRVQDYISKEWFDETDGSYFERLNSRLQVLLKKDYPDLQGHDFISNISLLDYRLVFLMKLFLMLMRKTNTFGKLFTMSPKVCCTRIRISRNNWIVELLLAKK